MHFPITHYEYLMKFLACDDFINSLAIEFNNRDVGWVEFATYFENDPDWISLVYKHRHTVNNSNLFVRHMFHSYKMKLHGEKIYYLSKDACNTLSKTRLTIDSEFIEAPFESFYMYTDQSSLILSDDTGSMPMRGVYINLAKESDGIKRLRFIATSGADGCEEGRDVNYFATFRIPDHGYLEDIVDRQIQDFLDGNGSFILNHDVSMDILREVFMFVVNALLYIGCKNVEFVHFVPDNIQKEIDRKKSNGKIKKLQKLIGRVAQCPFILVNPNKKYDAQERNMGIGKKLDHQVLVSGHWRGQWYGSEDGGTKRKEIIRIKSYIKGAELPEIKNKPYIVV